MLFLNWFVCSCWVLLSFTRIFSQLCNLVEKLGSPTLHALEMKKVIMVQCTV